MDIISLIQQKYGNNYQLSPPLNSSQYDEAKAILPEELLKIMKISNGIEETMINTNTGRIEVIGSIIYSYDDIKKWTTFYYAEYGYEGIVFAGDGVGGEFFIKPNGQIYYYEYMGEDGELFADSLSDFFKRLPDFDFTD